MDVSGVFSYAQLVAQGKSQVDIARSIEEGRLSRIARGWYANDFADREVVAALRGKGRLGCISGCKFYGLWVPPRAGLHVVQSPGQPKPYKPRYERHRSGKPVPKGPVWPLLECLEQVIINHDVELALIVIESALNLGKVTAGDIEVLLRHFSGKKIARIRKLLSIAESGSETRVRLFFRRRNVKVEPQVEIPGVGRVDMVVGKRLIVECDGAAYHTSRQALEDDKRRDLAARDLGFDSLRLSYRQVWDDWDATQKSLVAWTARRRH
ncbi:type IV toxin-antitoxin system AbiEi family antitoxin domain-containing protein [Actinomycetaceae bacterium L2_0104]